MSGCNCVGNFDLCILQGATYAKVFTWIAGVCCGQGTVGAQPAPVDLTGFSASMQIKPYSLSPTVHYDASGDQTLRGKDGTITLNIKPGNTQQFTWWEGVYDLLLADPSGNVTRLLSGDVSVCPGVTGPQVGQFVLLPGGQAADVPGGEGVLTP
jgi:hypothetical protein